MEKISQFTPTEYSESSQDEVSASEFDLPKDDSVVVQEETEEQPGIDMGNEKGKNTVNFSWDDNKDFRLFIDYVRTRLDKGVPNHDGNTSTGCERAQSFLSALDKEMSKAFREDVDGILDHQEAEKIRIDINKKVRALDKRIKELRDSYNQAGLKARRIKEAQIFGEDEEDLFDEDIPTDDSGPKVDLNHLEDLDIDLDALGLPGDKLEVDPEDVDLSASASLCPDCNSQLWKNAKSDYECLMCEKTYKPSCKCGDISINPAALKKRAFSPKINLMITPFERAITGAIINGKVSQGKDPEKTYDYLTAKYKLDDREQLSVQQLLMDMGYPIHKDRGLLGEDDKNPQGGGVELATNYWA